MSFLDPSLHRSARHAAAAMLVAVGLLAVGGSALAVESGANWAQLSSQEQNTLQPLEGLWSTIPGDRKQKWREVALRFPTMSKDEQSRIRERMVDWAKLSPAERGAARIGFEQSKVVPSAQRQASWEAYRALPEDQRKALASQAAERAATTATAAQPGAKPMMTVGASAPIGTASPVAKPGSTTATQPKSNIVSTSPVQVKPVAPAMVQATVGASTRPINQQPRPPEHHLQGQPKIAATPEFVNRTTLLPQRPAASGIEPPTKATP